jgi:hypothetical protein
MEVDDALATVETKIRTLKREYEMFFKGEARRAPLGERAKLQKAIEKLQAMHITSTQLKFRLAAVANQFLTLSQHWDRIMLQVEAGTYAPDRFKADLRVGRMSEVRGAAQQRQVDDSRATPAATPKQAPAALPEKPPAPPVTEPDPTKKLYQEFIDARRGTGEGTNVTYEAFKSSLDKQRPDLEAKLGKKVHFKIVVEDGRTKVKSYV